MGSKKTLQGGFCLPWSLQPTQNSLVFLELHIKNLIDHSRDFQTNSHYQTYVLSVTDRKQSFCEGSCTGPGFPEFASCEVVFFVTSSWLTGVSNVLKYLRWKDTNERTQKWRKNKHSSIIFTFRNMFISVCHFGQPVLSSNKFIFWKSALCEGHTL